MRDLLKRKGEEERKGKMKGTWKERCSGCNNFNTRVRDPPVGVPPPAGPAPLLGLSPRPPTLAPYLEILATPCDQPYWKRRWGRTQTTPESLIDRTWCRTSALQRYIKCTYLLVVIGLPLVQQEIMQRKDTDLHMLDVHGHWSLNDHHGDVLVARSRLLAIHDM